MQYQLNQLIDAKRTISEIGRIKQAKKMMPKLKQVGRKIDALAQSRKPLKIPARIIEDTAWRHSLARNKFSVTNVSGELEKLALRCENGVKEISIDQPEKISVPKRWKNCYLDVSGQTDTKFTLVEHPAGKKPKKKSQ